MYGDGIWEAMVSFVILLVVAAFSLGAAAVWLLPKLWEWLKPIIHASTS